MKISVNNYLYSPKVNNYKTNSQRTREGVSFSAHTDYYMIMVQGYDITTSNWFRRGLSCGSPSEGLIQCHLNTMTADMSSDISTVIRKRWDCLARVRLTCLRILTSRIPFFRQKSSALSTLALNPQLVASHPHLSILKPRYQKASGL